VDTRRFHHPEYKKQINAIRHHKRRVAYKPETTWRQLLFFLGFNSWKRQLFAFLVLAGFIYLSFFAPFMNLTRVEVAGATDPLKDAIVRAYSERVNSRRLLVFPQSNLMFFNTGEFTEKIIQDHYDVAGVKKANKSLLKGAHLSIEVDQREPVYALTHNDKKYVVYRDGFVGGEIADNMGLLELVDLADEEIKSGEHFLSDEKQQFINAINDNLKKTIGLEVLKYEMPGKGSDELIVYTKTDSKILLDTAVKPEVHLERLRLLWGQISPDRQRQLVYIDLRFDPNAYVCFRFDPCAK
jgi:hypothetical protein